MPVQRLLFHVSILPFLTFVMSCASSHSPPTPDERESADLVLEILLEHKTTPILEAFEALSSWSYSRYEFSENRGTSQYQLSSELIHIDSTGNSITIIDSDSIFTETSTNMIQAILPEDAPYFSQQFVDDFVYTLNRDTSYWSRPAHEIEIVSRSNPDHDFIAASFIYDTASRQLVHVNFQSVNRTILFTEQSSYQIQLRPVGAKWIPYRVSMNVALKLPLGKNQQYMRNVTYYNYTPRSTG